MAGVREHYENHLARYYAWISGGVELKIEENQKFFIDHNIQPIRSGLAFDLGAGCGFQSVPLAQLGFRVVAMDLSAKMLAQLKKVAKNLPIKTICDDLSNFANYERDNLELVVCMGDTLTHLDTLKKVQALMDTVLSALETGGRLILSFRNLTQELEGLDRFIPVKSSETTIFTCFLEFEKDSVKVHDIIYEKNTGQWVLKKSVFQKLRISPDWTQKYLQKIGFEIEFYDEQNGFIFIIARKK
jgi:2-polyprenyl-3-methyl-5-hydroxy-6-metoxy-1,4-benzoquinol methylase